ncbi:Hypothetical protein A7982_01072 [Minicystis rosea]|nr:Hypothetical protein A7982_01072 [Minicystis rosea]
MVMSRSIPILAALAAWITLAPTARAAGDAPANDAASAPPIAAIRVHHAPLASAKAHEDLQVSVRFEHIELMRSAALAYRLGDGPFKSVPIQRGPEGYVGIIPADDVVAPGLAYAIEVEHLDGTRIAVFATRVEPQPIAVLEDRMDARERAKLKRLDDRRSVITATAELVRFGVTSGDKAIPCAAGQPSCPAGSPRVPSVYDQYWRTEIGYTYRPLRTVAEFGIRIGVARGTSLVSLPKLDQDRYRVGLNYASPSVRFRMHDNWHADFSLLASITEVGFSVGGGTALLIGDPYGTHLTLGAESIGFQKGTYFGSRFYGRFDLLVRHALIIAPSIEATDMPHAGVFGIRLLADVVATLPHGISFGIRGGYQARKSDSGGVTVGTTLGVAF